MTAEILIAISAGIALAMGTVHLLGTLFTDTFTPRDPALAAQLETASLKFSKHLLLGRGLVGFNISHSLGPMMFGLIYGYLALRHGEFLLQSPFLLTLGAGVLAAYVVTAWRYWFYAPLAGVALALAVFLAGVAVSL